MKVRRVTIEIEVPWEFSAEEVLECVWQGLDEVSCFDVSYVQRQPVPHQEQVVKDELSLNTQIGDATEWPLTRSAANAASR